jgi:hypothetical protein
LIFAHRLGKDPWLQRLQGIDSILPTDIDAGEHKLTGLDTSYVLRNLDPLDDNSVAENEGGNWFSPLGVSLPSAEQSPRFFSPSQVQVEAGQAEAARLELLELSGVSYFPTDVREEDYASFGDAIHAYMAALPSLRGVDDSRKQKVALRCLAAYSIDGKLAPSVLVAIGNRFVQWANDTFPEATWRVEVPILAARAAGGSWNGTLDLILEQPDGNVVVIDHKSAPIRRQHCAEKAAQFFGQLAAYREVLTATGHTVESEWIHFPIAGVMVRRTLEQM